MIPAYTLKMQRILPPLRLHAWGGLGSQLFAIALAEDLKLRFPRRSLKIILHTGGVTRRAPEVVELFPEYQYEYIEDFKIPARVDYAVAIKSKNGLKMLLRKTLKAFGFLAECNNDSQYRGLKLWTLSIRGHYSYRSINPIFLRNLSSLILSPEDNDSIDVSNLCVIHYRLGDLISLAEKNPVNAHSLSGEYNEIRKANWFNGLIVFSDSPTEAERLLKQLIFGRILVKEARTSAVIAAGIQASYFIGTTSKVSFWIVGIRAVLYGKGSSLPIGNYAESVPLLRIDSGLIRTY